MEIVTEPDLSSPYEATEYIKKLRSILRYVGSCDGNMEQGSMRCDANVSVRRKGSKELGTRCEIKNLNSTRNIAKAIEYEAIRQVELIESGQKVQQETRLFDTTTGMTRTMRSKEDANDYRYFPDPDLLPLVIDDALIERLKQEIPELPDQKMQRYISDLGLSPYDSSVIANDDEVARFFEEASVKASPKLIANWICSELFGLLNKTNALISSCNIKPVMLEELVHLIETEVISGKMAKTVFEEMFATGKKASSIVSEKGLVQISDEKEIENIVKTVIEQNPDVLAEYLSGKEKLFGFFVGQVMKETQGKASPQVVNKILKEKLKK
jgi:aspartyl-tRNA(Asn)/glutamyl-tRNA(Gln) amidotransferase subunit B